MNSPVIFGWKLEKVGKSKWIILMLGSLCICVWYMLIVWLYVGSDSDNSATANIRETSSDVLYLLGKSPRVGYCEKEQLAGFATSRPTVALGCAVREGGAEVMKSYLKSPKQWLNMHFLYILFLSFLNTATPNYDYHFYVAYDPDDITMTTAVTNGFLVSKADEAAKRTMSVLNRSWSLNYTFHFVLCPYSGKPAWAQNDAMLAAYMDHHDYYYRVNDDSDMASFHWTEKFINTLEEYEPVNIGVVGPRHFGGKRNILTHEFVHRSHIDIFGFYYPRELTDWFADDWISAIYGPRRTRKMSDVKLNHWVSNVGTRYTPHPAKASTLNQLVWRDRDVIRK